ncbi:MAG: 50S ribosomal protein L23 [Clostridia bacterium]|nr:50S ribosomal protein L23 [Clostridia bacterium]
MKSIYDIVIAPVITEASMDGIAAKTYTFKVAKDATKPEIASAVEKLFGVEVKSVNTMIMKKKPKRRGVTSGYTSEWKKAVVTLTESSKTIAFFDGMM